MLVGTRAIIKASLYIQHVFWYRPNAQKGVEIHLLCCIICRKAILELMQAIDDYIPDPIRALDKPFSLPVEDVFSIQGRGTVVTGRIEQGVVKVGEEIEIIGIQPPTKTTVTGQCLSLLPQSGLQIMCLRFSSTSPAACVNMSSCILLHVMHTVSPCVSVCASTTGDAVASTANLLH